MVDINIYEIIMQMINFLILVYILKRILYTPMLKFLEDRSHGIKEAIDSAKQNREAAQKLLEKQETELKKSKKEALQIRYDAEHHGKREREKIIIEAGKQTEKMLEQARVDISAQVSSAKRDLKNQIATVSVQIASKLIEKNIDKKASESFIEKTLTDIKK